METELWKLWDKTREETLELYSGFQFHTGLEKAFHFIGSINRYAEQRAPWKLAKSEVEADKKLLNTPLFVMAEALRLAVGLVEPVMPETKEKVYTLLGYESDAEWESRLVRTVDLAGNIVGGKTILFPKPQTDS